MTLTEAYDEAASNEYIMNWYNGRHYKKSEIKTMSDKLEFWYAMDDGWIVVTEKQMVERTYNFN